MLVCPAMESVPGAIATGSHDVWWRSRDPVATTTPRGLPRGDPRSARGTDPHHRDASGSLEIVQFLIDNKADVNAKTSDGQTPLGMIKKYLDVADLLRKHGGK
jgi:hypothetical protein